MHLYRLKTEPDFDSNLATEAYFYTRPETSGQPPDETSNDPFVLSISVNEKNGELSNPAGPSVTRFGEIFGYDQWAGLNWARWTDIDAAQVPPVVTTHAVAARLLRAGYAVWSLADTTAESHVYDEANARLERRYNITRASMWKRLAIIYTVAIGMFILIGVFGLVVRHSL